MVGMPTPSNNIPVVEEREPQQPQIRPRFKPVTQNQPVDPIVKLRHPLARLTGLPLTELNVDPDILEMADYHNLELEYSALWPGVQPVGGMYMADSKYRALVIGRINGVQYEQMAKLKGRDAQKVDMRFQAFLMQEE